MRGDRFAMSLVWSTIQVPSDGSPPACGLGPLPNQRWLCDQGQSESNPFKKNNNNNDDLRFKLGLWVIWDNVGDLLARLWTDLLKMCWLYKCRGDAVRQCGPDQIRLALILHGTSRFKQASQKWRQLHVVENVIFFERHTPLVTD